jgi:hypothetical protein
MAATGRYETTKYLVAQVSRRDLKLDLTEDELQTAITALSHWRAEKTGTTVLHW